MEDGTKVYSLTTILKMFLTNSRLDMLPPGAIRIVIGGDSGGDGSKKTVKIGFFFADFPKSRSPNNFFVLSIKKGGDEYKNIFGIVNIINKDVTDLSINGLNIHQKHLTFEL